MTLVYCLKVGNFSFLYNVQRIKIKKTRMNFIKRDVYKKYLIGLSLTIDNTLNRG